MPVEHLESGKLVKLSTKDGKCMAQVYLHGATVTSWEVLGTPVLFLSSKAILDGSKAIRGGIPIVFPQFGLGPQSLKVQHGFARSSAWTWMGLDKDTDSELTASFSLEVDEKTLSAWPHKFRLKYSVTLVSPTTYSPAKLTTMLSVHNTDSTKFDFTALMHTYFRLNTADPATISVSGLKGCQYQDKTRGGETFKDEQDKVTVSSELDRSYIDVPGAVHVAGVGPNGITIQPHKFHDVVVWNPWLDKAKAMADFGDEEYEQMVCVEIGAVGAGKDMSERQITLAAGETFEAGQTISLLL